MEAIGLVHGVAEDEGSVRLEARFPGEASSRLIALEAVEGGEYIMPGDVRARYRPLDAEDRERLEQARRERSALAAA
jgi:hypothetical protein